MPLDGDKYYFKIGFKSTVISKLKEFFSSKIILKYKNNKTAIFDSELQSAISAYQKNYNLKMQDGILNEETYAQVGKELLDVQIDLMSFQHPILKKLLYGVGLADICGDWESIAPIIAKSDFVGWNAAGIEKNCYSYCVAQLKKSGNSLRSAGWGTTIAINPNIYQLFLTEDIAGMKKGYQAQQFTEGVLYLKKAIKSKTPVMVGVDAHADVDSKGKVKHVNKDKVTDHFVVIVGMNSDVSGKYFLFYDNATGDQEVGTSDQNKIYCSCINFSLIGTGANSYAQGGYGQYTITQIRESK